MGKKIIKGSKELTQTELATLFKEADVRSVFTDKNNNVSVVYCCEYDESTKIPPTFKLTLQISHESEQLLKNLCPLLIKNPSNEQFPIEIESKETSIYTGAGILKISHNFHPHDSTPDAGQKRKRDSVDLLNETAVKEHVEQVLLPPFITELSRLFADSEVKAFLVNSANNPSATTHRFFTDKRPDENRSKGELLQPSLTDIIEKTRENRKKGKESSLEFVWANFGAVATAAGIYKLIAHINKKILEQTLSIDEQTYLNTETFELSLFELAKLLNESSENKVTLPTIEITRQARFEVYYIDKDSSWNMPDISKMLFEDHRKELAVFYFELDKTQLGELAKIFNDSFAINIKVEERNINRHTTFEEKSKPVLIIPYNDFLQKILPCLVLLKSPATSSKNDKLRALSAMKTMLKDQKPKEEQDFHLPKPRMR